MAVLTSKSTQGYHIALESLMYDGAPIKRV
ncbi:uncharacterized protein METZ01_LOCUS84263 [marine metagenome]|uniref:Uncharacterized protein n=1 Tax=marine metagenome TaxID=408172 RepID=A0A381UTE7_9ZZZZ